MEQHDGERDRTDRADNSMPSEADSNFVTENPMLLEDSLGTDGTDMTAYHLSGILEGKDQIIFDAVSVNFDISVFLRQFFIQVIPFVALFFQPCLQENLEHFGFAFSLLKYPGRRQYFLINQLPALGIFISIICSDRTTSLLPVAVTTISDTLTASAIVITW